MNRYYKKKIYLCEVDCEFSGYNNKKNNAECNCPIKIKLSLISDITVNKEKLMNHFFRSKI